MTGARFIPARGWWSRSPRRLSEQGRRRGRVHPGLLACAGERTAVLLGRRRLRGRAGRRCVVAKTPGRRSSARVRDGEERSRMGDRNRVGMASDADVGGVSCRRRDEMADAGDPAVCRGRLDMGLSALSFVDACCLWRRGERGFGSLRYARRHRGSGRGGGPCFGGRDRGWSGFAQREIPQKGRAEGSAGQLVPP